ncbi:hypothetical protein, partial [Klebsiella pneumoniae]|uniref:hypothetical protein n=1 Tax=Klebsiella pneumoniae TaxID=573 RepID=UPI0013D163A5
MSHAKERPLSELAVKRAPRKMPATTSGALMAGADAVPNIYFSDLFSVPPKILEEYGAFDVALVNDLPLFVDPFLLYD